MYGVDIDMMDVINYKNMSVRRAEIIHLGKARYGHSGAERVVVQYVDGEKAWGYLKPKKCIDEISAFFWRII